MCVRFLVQGLKQQKAVKGAIVVPSDNHPLGSSNAVEFVFICRGVNYYWQLWACPLSRSGWGLAQKGAVRPRLGLTPKGQLVAQKLYYWIARLWCVTTTTPLSSCFYLKPFGCYDRVRFQGQGQADPKIG